MNTHSDYTSLSIPVNEATIHDCSLVLSSAGIHHRISPASNGNYSLLVPENDLYRAEYELDSYFRENDNWPLQPPKLKEYSPLFRAHSILLMGVMMIFFGITGPWDQHSDWFSNGSANSTLILGEHQLHRLITALTLHADIVHLLGNCFLGGILLHFFLHLVGNGIGTSSILLASASANYLNAVVHGPGHNSVGFSTAVFSVIGILSALNYNRYRFSRPMQLIIPFMAGAALLAMLGSSGERTDLGAHFFGLGAGLITGLALVLTKVERLRHKFSLQMVLNLASITTLLLAWQLAFA